MPQGELFLRSKVTYATQSLQSDTGLVTTVPQDWNDGSGGSYTYNNVGWVDAYLRYGLSLEDGARSKLITPAPKKKPTNASEPTLEGVAFSGETIGKTDKREFSFDLHITAPDEATFLQRYDLFCKEILKGQYFQLKHFKRPAEVRHLLYDDCEPFSEFRLQMAKFTLAVTEPHPEIVDNRVPTIMQQ